MLIVQSGTFSGHNLALFGLPLIRLRAMEEAGAARATRVLAVRRDGNFALSTILWGNVATNVLLTLLSDSLMVGATAFFFSTFVITLGGEILPQGYFSRNALTMASRLTPMLRFYQRLLYPLARPSALFLDAWLGRETIDFVPEAELREGLRLQASDHASDMSLVEGHGAANFLELDDVPLAELGHELARGSVLGLPHRRGQPLFPREAEESVALVQRLVAVGTRRVVIVDEAGAPSRVLDMASLT